MKIPKCSKTLSGKHKWREFFDGVDEKKTDKETKRIHKMGYVDSFLWVPKYMTKCSACGMIDDRRKK